MTKFKKIIKKKFKKLQKIYIKQKKFNKKVKIII